MEEMDGERINELAERKRSHSVPILSQIEVLGRGELREDFGAVRFEGGVEKPSFPETRSPRNTTRQRERRLWSGGLMRSQKRRHGKAGLMERKQTSFHEQEYKLNEQYGPSAFTDGVAANTGQTESLDDCRDIALALHENHSHRRKRSKSLPLAQENYSQYELTNSDDIVCVEQTTRVLHRSVSLPTCLHDTAENNEKETRFLEMIKPFNLNPSYMESLIGDFEKLSFNRSERSEQERKGIFSDLGRRQSLPCRLEESQPSCQSSAQNGVSFNDHFTVDTASQKTEKMKTQRSRSLPLTSSSFVGEVSDKDEFAIAVNHCRVECGFRQPLGKNMQPKEHIQKRKKYTTIRSKSLPLVLDAEGEANMPVSLINHVKQKSLLNPDDKLYDVKRRRAKSLPSIYEGQFTEQELLLCESRIAHNPNLTETKLEGTQTNEITAVIKQKAQLERARWLPLSLPGGRHSQITRHIQDHLNTAIDAFFSQVDEEHPDVCCGERSKSLPNVLEGGHTVRFTPAVTKALEDHSGIPDIVIAHDNVHDGLYHVERDDQSCGESEHNCLEQEEYKKSEQSNSGASLDCDELRHETTLDPQQPNKCYPDKLLSRPRGFSVPSSFKLEKILEEPNEIENCETLSCCELHSGENETNGVCKEDFTENNTTDNKRPAEKNNGQDHTVASETSRDTPEGNQEAYERGMARFNNIVSKVSSTVRQLEFSKSSSSLHRAAAGGDLEYVKLLVEGGDDVNALDETGWPVLHAAVTTGNFDCGAWLIEAGANLVDYTNSVIEEYRMLSRQVYDDYW